VFNTAKFFNKQASGLRLKDLHDDEILDKLLQPLATFKSNSPSHEEFIAIAEGRRLPLYVFSYGIEMTQFYFEDPIMTNDAFMLDHSIIARTHAQFIAN